MKIVIRRRVARDVRRTTGSRGALDDPAPAAHRPVGSMPMQAIQAVIVRQHR
jgi:hypothetical protein